MDCGTTWKAADLYRVLVTIEEITGERLNLAHKADRVFMEDFVSEIGGWLGELQAADFRAEELLKSADGVSHEVPSLQMTIYLPMAMLFAAFSFSIGITFGVIASLMLLILFPIVQKMGDGELKKKNAALRQERIKEDSGRAAQMRSDARKRLNSAVEDFLSRH